MAEKIIKLESKLGNLILVKLESLPRNGNNDFMLYVTHGKNHIYVGDISTSRDTLDYDAKLLKFKIGEAVANYEEREGVVPHPLFEKLDEWDGKV